MANCIEPLPRSSGDARQPGIILLVPVGLLSARVLGFRPTTQVFTALETIVVNLCWAPPLVGWLRGRPK